MVPALISSIKVAGLILVTDTSAVSPSALSTASSSTRPAAIAAAPAFDGVDEGIDGFLKSEGGVLRFRDTIDV